jgi:hypothetical protein
MQLRGDEDRQAGVEKVNESESGTDGEKIVDEL